MNIPENLKYTKDHEWIRVEGNEAFVGITEYAQAELGDIVYVEVETVGETIAENESFGTIEAVKTVSDMYMPVTGEILQFNEELEANPEFINSDPYGAGWIIKLHIENADELSGLLSPKQYGELIGA